MQNTKKIKLLTTLVLLGSVVIFSFNVAEQPEPKKLKNLKVFPSTATYREVDHAMDQFKVDLGVKCNYCHAPSKNNPKKLDMASDENPKKDISREMMRMTAELNNKYISKIPHADTAKVQMVTCNTCHRGSAKPTFATNTSFPKVEKKENNAQLPPPPARNK